MLESVICVGLINFFSVGTFASKIHVVGPFVLFSAYIGSAMLPDRLFSSALVRTS